MRIIQLKVEGLRKDSAQAFEAAAKSVAGVKKVDAWPGEAEIAALNAVDEDALLSALRDAGFDVSIASPEMTKAGATQVFIDGMTCRACEITIERKFKKVRGIKKVDVNAAKGIATVLTEDGSAPDLESLRGAVAGDGYRIRGVAAGGVANAERPSLLRLAVLFGLVLILGSALSKVGLFDQGYQIGGSTNFTAALLIGLLAGSSSCMAVSGGLLLSTAGKFRDAYGGSSRLAGMAPVIMFVSGRVLSYGLLGGVIGVVGSALTPSPIVTGVITLIAAAFMLIMGLDMLKIAPRWLIGLLPRMPKALSHRIMDAEGKVHPAMPASLGAATFFIPCGFTQALQIYALTTGSFLAGAAVLTGFALGTSPALLALGWASSSLKGKAGKLFFQFSGALVVVLGLWNVQNGFTVAGYPLSLPSFDLPAIQAGSTVSSAKDPNVALEGGTQVIKMKLGADPFYLPSDEYTVKAGVPVRMEIAGIGTGCRSIFQIPRFGVRIALNQALNVVEFTPDKTGDAAFSCSMGMFRGTLHVVGS